MKKSFYRKHNADWFRNKVGVALCEIQNGGGGVIKKGEKFLFSGKSRHGGHCIRSAQGMTIDAVGLEKVDLV